MEGECTAVTCKEELDPLLEREAENVVILKFSADWCAPCKEFAPSFYELVREKQGVKVVDINSDSSQSLFEQYEIKGMPTFLLFKNQSLEARLRKPTIDEIHTELKKLLPRPVLTLDEDF
jgi:thiol-disulfide isomerase/thioredoxin